MTETQGYKNVCLSILDLTEIEFALQERIARLDALASALDAKDGDAVFVLLERDRAALAKVAAAL